MQERMRLDVAGLRVETFEVGSEKETVKPYQLEITTIPCVTKGPDFC